MANIWRWLKRLLDHNCTLNLYPNNCIRGIPNNTYLTPNGVGSNLFYFEREPGRNDGWLTRSINWEDNEKVIDFTLKQKRDDNEIHFKAGIAIIPRIKIDDINKFHSIKGKLSYERKAIPGNKYHGNLLLKEDVPKPVMKQIAGSIALAVSNIITANNRIAT